MSFRGAHRGRGGSFGGNRGGAGARGSMLDRSKLRNATGTLILTGRSGFQQSYGPPAAVLGSQTSLRGTASVH